MGEFRMPSLGADMDVGTIVDWLVKPGDQVTRGQIVAVVDTAKAAIEIEAFETGVVEKILVDTGVQVPVGTPLALIGARQAGTEKATPAEKASATAPPPSSTAPVLVPPRATPPVRHLAHQLGIDLDTVPGTGQDGHVTHDDVLTAAALIGPAASAATSAPAVSARSRVSADQSSRTPTGGREGPAGPVTRVAQAGGPRGAITTPRAQVPSVPPGRVPGGRLRATPRARRLAAERGIDLDAVVGTGHDGAILAADVRQAPTLPSPSPRSDLDQAAARDQQVPVVPPVPPVTDAAHSDRKEAMRTAIASLMARSNAEIPHYYVTQTVDLGHALTWLHQHNAPLPPERRLLPAVLFLRATVLAALAVPDLNGHWISGTLRPAERVDLGVAVATRGGGLVTPAIPDAASLSTDDLMARLADLVRRARRGILKRAELAGASITVSALGETGPDALYGVIFPPQVALVGVGGIVDRPWAINGMLAVRPTASVVLAADHRASDGRTASAFLATFAHALDHPEDM